MRRRRAAAAALAAVALHAAGASAKSQDNNNGGGSSDQGGGSSWATKECAYMITEPYSTTFQDASDPFWLQTPGYLCVPRVRCGRGGRGRGEEAVREQRVRLGCCERELSYTVLRCSVRQRAAAAALAESAESAAPRSACCTLRVSAPPVWPLQRLGARASRTRHAAPEKRWPPWPPL
jgi:hypothetical protein